MSTQATPLARISAAIEKLERLKAESTPTRWVFSEGSIITMGMGYSVADELRESDADLIVALHRTIDVQLHILKYGRDWINLHGPEEADHSEAHFTLLADAILGGES